MLKVITTVGTSIFSNYEKTGQGNLNWNYLEKTFEHKDEIRSEREKNKIKAWMEDIEDKTEISAEVKSLLKLKEEKTQDLEVYLLATDTVGSSLAAEIIKEFFEGDNKIYVNFNPDYDVIRDLDVSNSNNFIRHGLANLINRIEKIAGGYYGNVIFNITGGYKGVIPYMTIMGIVNKCEIKYIYEYSKQLITIPQLPLSIDELVFESHYETLSKFEDGVEDYLTFKSTNFSTCEQLEKQGLIEYEEDTGFLSPIGHILFNYYKNKFIWFYASDEVFEKIEGQLNIKRMLKYKFFENYTNKTEYKNGHYVYDDGKNQYRIFYFEKKDKDKEKIYIYNTFEDHDEYEKYLKKTFSTEFKINYKNSAKLRKYRKEEQSNV